MARISDPIPVEDATRIERHPDGSRTPSDVLQAMASGNSATTWVELIEDVNGLYRCGYAVVKVLPEPGSPEAKLADAAAELEASVNRWEPVRRAMDGDWVDDMRQAVERRLGVPAGDPAVLDDPAYVAVLDADRALVKARDAVASAIARVEADQ